MQKSISVSRFQIDKLAMWGLSITGSTLDAKLKFIDVVFVLFVFIDRSIAKLFLLLTLN